MKYFESVRLLFRLRKLMGLPVWQRPAFPGIDDWSEWVESAINFFGMIVLLVVWPFIWLLMPLQPLWLAALKPHDKIRRAVEKWERDLATKKP